MPTITTYTTARAALAALCDEVVSTREPVIIKRRGAEDVALVSASELEGLLETAHLLRSPKNAASAIWLAMAALTSSRPAITIEIIGSVGLTTERSRG